MQTDPTASTSDPAVAAAAARLQAIRDARFPALAAAAARAEGSRRRVRGPRRDPSLHDLLAQPARDMRVRALAMAQAGAAIRAALSRDIAEQVVAASYFRGVLTLAAPDAAVRFHLERQLRAGGERAILSMLRTPTARIRVVIGSVASVLPNQPRSAPTVLDAERDAEADRLDG